MRYGMATDGDSAEGWRKGSREDVDGNEQVTWFCDGDWVYAGWRETEDRDEYETEEWWEPTEWMPRQARSNAGLRGRPTVPMPEKLTVLKSRFWWDGNGRRTNE